ncbi:hypothetical protein ACFVHW_18880 [Streptomyces sp. NPDC127110]
MNDGHVAVFRGIDQELGGTPLWELETDHPEIEEERPLTAQCGG